MTAPSIAHLPYRSGVGIILINNHRQAFVAKRIDTISEAWQMPQGGIDKGEEPAQAAMRELMEETGVTRVHIIAETPDWLDYDLPADLVPKIWGGRYRGQKQKWFLMQLEGGDEQINIETEHPEFCEWKWVAPAELPHLIVPFKRDLYTQLLQIFAQHLNEIAN